MELNIFDVTCCYLMYTCFRRIYFFPFDSYNTNYDLEKIEEYEWEFIILLQNYF